MFKKVWRDIYSVEDWHKLREATHWAHGQAIEELTKLINEYHEVEKTELKEFSIRIALLKNIAAKARKYEFMLGDKCNKKVGKNNVTPYPEQKIAGSIDPWIHSLGKRADKKAAYLKKLKAYYKDEFQDYEKGHPQYREERLRKKYRDITKSSLMETIREQEEKHGQHGLFGLHGVTIMEKIDPFHRPIEMKFADIESWEPGTLSMNEAFIEWANRPTELPFFLWLENHPLLTSTNHVSANWELKYKDVTSINYDPKDLHLAVIKEGLIVEYTTSEEDETKPVTTSSLIVQNVPKSGHFEGCVAFVWDKTDQNHFVMHEHVVNEFHHSSLAHGRKVRFAGMWLITEGELQFISNSSGHYKTDVLAFYRLIRHLFENAIKGTHTTVNIYGKHSGTFDNFMSFFKYAEETMLEVRHYLKDNKLDGITIRCQDISIIEKPKKKEVPPSPLFHLTDTTTEMSNNNDSELDEIEEDLFMDYEKEEPKKEINVEKQNNKNTTKKKLFYEAISKSFDALPIKDKTKTKKVWASFHSAIISRRKKDKASVSESTFKFS